jgi:hypothetical protein
MEGCRDAAAEDRANPGRGYAAYYYAAYYNVSRTHRSLSKDAPLHRAIERLGAVVSQPVLGDLHHQYCRI